MAELEQASDAKQLGLFQRRCNGRSETGSQKRNKGLARGAQPDAPNLIVARR
jgi:hypothetical protein